MHACVCVAVCSEFSVLNEDKGFSTKGKAKDGRDYKLSRKLHF